MHRCVSVFDGTYYKITTTNYIFKTSLYTTFRTYPWGPWPLKILMFALLVTHEIATYTWPWEKTGESFFRCTWIYILRFSELYLEVFVPRKKKEIAENITAGSGNLKTQNLRTSSSSVSPNSGSTKDPEVFQAVIQLVQNNVTTHGHILWVVWPSPKPRFHKRPGSFPGSYSTHSKQRDHPRPYTMGCLTITQTRVPQKTRKFSRQLFDLFETKWPPKAKYSWVVWPSPKPGFHKRPESFPGSYLTCSKQSDHPRPNIHGLFDHHSYISKLDICSLDIHGYQCDVQRGFGLISDTRPTLVTTYWKRRFTVPASPPSLGNIGPVTKWNWPARVN